MSSADDLDQQMRLAAFRHVAAVANGGEVRQRDLRDGFHFEDRDYQVIMQSGIWKPAAMRYVLSLRLSPKPRSGEYNDWQRSLEAVASGRDSIPYDFARGDHADAANQLLLDAFAAQVPFIFFFGTRPSPHHYLVAAPAYISLIDLSGESCRIAFGTPDRGVSAGLPGEDERAEAMRQFRERLSRYVDLPPAKPPLRLERPVRLVAEDPPG